MTQLKAKDELRKVEKDIKEVIRGFQKQRARDKADLDITLKTQADQVKYHAEKLEGFAVNFEALAIVNSMMIENINMQMESEIADMLDRRMMSLYGINMQNQPNKIDAQQNTSKKFKAALGRSPSPRYHDIRMSMEDATTVIDEKVRQSVTIGLNPSNTFESIDSVARELDHKA